MDDSRSKSSSNGRTQMELYTNVPPNPKSKTDFRSYSTSSSQQQQQQDNRDVRFNKVKSVNGSSSACYTSKSWSFTDPELQRKKRVASYKVYVVEGKLKGSIRKSFKWVKDRCTQAVHGWR